MLAPDGLFASLTGPFPGSRNDRQKIDESKVLEAFEQALPSLKILGDAGFTFDPTSIMVRNIPANMCDDACRAFNHALASLRVPVEWPFGAILHLFPYLRQATKQKLNTPLLSFYRVCCMLYNAFICMGYGPREVSEYFSCQPPSLDEYFAT